MSKHTPGPWNFSWQIQPNGCPTVGSNGLMVCMVAHSAKNPEQKDTALANASLISAAPDLLAALELTFKLSGDRLSVFEEIQIRDIIAKAKGGQQ